MKSVLQDEGIRKSFCWTDFHRRN